MVILNTKRLLLRHLEPGDLDPLYALYRDPEIRKYYPDGTRTHRETKEELDWFLHGHPRHPELGLWATVEHNTGEFLGRCGLLPWHIRDTDEVELAFMIKKERWREGLATEAAHGIIKHARDVLGLRRLVCLVMPGNTASAGVAEKVGMSFEREFTDEFGPCHLYSVALPTQVSGPGELPPQALSEPYVNLSIHTAPSVQPPRTTDDLLSSRAHPPKS